MNLFLSIAKAQPLEDGNKRTTIFVGNELLIRERAYELLTAPLHQDEKCSFNDLLERAYVYGEGREVKTLTREGGSSSVPHRS